MTETESTKREPGGPTTGQFAAVLALLVLVVGTLIVVRNGAAFLDWLRDLIAYLDSGDSAAQAGTLSSRYTSS